MVLKFMVAFLKSLTNSENPSSHPLVPASGIVIASCDSTVIVVPKAAGDFKNSSKSRL
jgi:hypothetical protein